MKYIFGGFGCNNIGDEAIFEGANIFYNGNLIPIHVNMPICPNSILYSDLLQGKIKFDKNIGDELIIGGGGILHCKGAIVDDIRIAALAQKEGIPVSIQRIGAEELQEDYTDKAKMLFDMATSISARTTISQKIIEDLGYLCKLERDFAYELNKPSYKKFYHAINKDVPNIILATAPMEETEIKNMTMFVSNLLNDTNFNIIHVPHSKAHRSASSNDVITGEIIWSSININEKDRQKRYHNIPYISSPEDIISLYSQVDGVITQRYHAAIFADIANKPLYVSPGRLKLESFLKDNPAPKQVTNDLNTFIKYIDK